MKPFILFFALLSVVLAQNYAERQCACTLSTLWLDVVAVLDTSAGMTVNGIQEAVANIIGVFAQSSISQKYGQTTRLGIVSYSDKASTLAPLTYFNSTSDLFNEMFTLVPSRVTGDQSYLKTGLSQAQDVLKNGRPGTTRNNVKQVILVYASDYMSSKDGVHNPTALANQIKEAGITIITVAFDQGGESQILQGLKFIATRSMGYSNKDADVTGEIQEALCQDVPRTSLGMWGGQFQYIGHFPCDISQSNGSGPWEGLCYGNDTANCFCPYSWQQFTNNYYNATMGYGTCLKLVELENVWFAARDGCNALYPNAYLATEFDSDKHSFNTALLKADPTTSSAYSFHFGLSYNETINCWQWEQPNRNTLIADQSTTAYTKWNNGYPDSTYNYPNQGCVINTRAGTSFSPYPNLLPSYTNYRIGPLVFSQHESNFFLKGYLVPVSKLGWQNENCISVASRYMCQVNSCDTDNYCTFSINL